jgi:two-component system response regulator AtoC
MKVLVVDDEKHIRDSLKRFMKLEGIEVVCAENGLSGKRLLEEEVFAACVVDLKMPGISGLELLRWIRNEGLRTPVIMISAYGEINDAVGAMKSGAQDYIVKPFDPEELLIRLKKIIEDQALRNQLDSGKRLEKLNDELIGESEGIVKIKKMIDKIAKTPSTVLIIGESGVGKEVVARLLHAHSTVANGPFIGVNIGGVPENLIESELFGHEKGSFTGAVSRKIGMFELASSGTLFLDEIGEMPMPLQVKLLRVLQEKRIMRLGSTQGIPINARIISATNKNLEERVKEGRFRDDLYYRLNVVRIEVPPIRERLDDIPLLVGRFIERLNLHMGKNIESVSPDALKKLQRYSFPGNVRELENIIERAFIFAESPTIEVADIEIKDNYKVVPAKPSTLKNVEKQTIMETLQRWEGNRTKAAEELGITRRTIINKIKEYGIDITSSNNLRKS